MPDQNENKDQQPKTLTCQKCGHVGDADKDFGFREHNGERRYQSWCRRCRMPQRN